MNADERRSTSFKSAISNYLRSSAFICGLTAFFAVALLYLPMLAIAVLSFNRSRFGTSWRGFTFDWYARLWHNDVILRAAWNTLALAVISTLVAMILGTTLAL